MCGRVRRRIGRERIWHGGERSGKLVGPQMGLQSVDAQQRWREGGGKAGRGDGRGELIAVRGDSRKRHLKHVRHTIHRTLGEHGQAGGKFVGDREALGGQPAGYGVVIGRQRKVLRVHFLSRNEFAACHAGAQLGEVSHRQHQFEVHRSGGLLGCQRRPRNSGWALTDRYRRAPWRDRHNAVSKANTRGPFRLTPRLRSEEGQDDGREKSNEPPRAPDEGRADIRGGPAISNIEA